MHVSGLSVVSPGLSRGAHFWPESVDRRPFLRLWLLFACRVLLTAARWQHCTDLKNLSNLQLNLALWTYPPYIPTLPSKLASLSPTGNPRQNYEGCRIDWSSEEGLSGSAYRSQTVRRGKVGIQ